MTGITYTFVQVVYCLAEEEKNNQSPLHTILSLSLTHLFLHGGDLDSICGKLHIINYQITNKQTIVVFEKHFFY